MHFTRTAIWCETGFKVAPKADVYAAKIGDTPVLALEFESLNPQVRFTQCMSRWELLRVALWFTKQAARRWQ